MKHLTLFLLLCILGCNANEVPKGYPPQTKGEYQWPEWPENGTYWECMVELGFIN